MHIAYHNDSSYITIKDVEQDRSNALINEVDDDSSKDNSCSTPFINGLENKICTNLRDK